MKVWKQPDVEELDVSLTSYMNVNFQRKAKCFSSPKDSEWDDDDEKYGKMSYDESGVNDLS